MSTEVTAEPFASVEMSVRVTTITTAEVLVAETEVGRAVVSVEGREVVRIVEVGGTLIDEIEIVGRLDEDELMVVRGVVMTFVGVVTGRLLEEPEGETGGDEIGGATLDGAALEG